MNILKIKIWFYINKYKRITVVCHLVLVHEAVSSVILYPFWSSPGEVLDISLGGEVRRGSSYRDPVKTNIASSYPVEDRIPIFDTLFKTFN